jgi:hypothetical protein
LLFDGKTTQGWKSANGKPFPEAGWKIEDGVIWCDPSEGRGGDIVTESEFSDFELSLEFKLTERANSGIKYFYLHLCPCPIYDHPHMSMFSQKGLSRDRYIHIHYRSCLRDRSD